MINPDGHRFRTFNPGLAQSDAEIVDQFVVRHEELHVLLDTLKENVESDICQNLLIIGQRGSGKTMLLARVMAELRTNTEYRGVIPIRFSEESDEIINATRFWLEVLRQISQEIRYDEPQLAEDANATIQDLSDRWRDSTAENQAQSAALRLVHLLDKKLILMVENLQSLLSSADKSFGWKLREALQSSSRLMFIGTATLRFESMERVEMPFFEFFRVIKLEPLKLDSCQKLWNKLTRDRFPSRQVRPLEILTGGNPRLLVVASNFAFHDSLIRLMDELIRLVDHYTEYFKSRLEEIPTKERIVFLSMLDLWQDSTLKEISTRAQMSSRSVSGLLNRLTARGVIVKLGSGRKHVYSVNERLFCFYYKLRYRNDGVAVVEYLVNFMASFYSGAELRQLRNAISEEAKTTPFIFDGLLRARENFRFKFDGELRTRYNNSVDEAHKSIANLLWVNEILESSVAGNHELASKNERAIWTRRDNQNRIDIKDLEYEPDVDMSLHRIKELINEYEIDKALEELGKALQNLDSAPSKSDDVTRAYFVSQIGVLSSIMNRERDSAYAFDYIVDHFCESNDSFVRKLYISALKYQAMALGDDGLVEDALNTLDTAIEYLENLERLGTLNHNSYISHEDLFDIRVQQGTLLRDNGRLEEGLRVLDEILETDQSKSDPEYKSGVETAQIEKGITLRELGRIGESVNAFNKVIETSVLSEPPKLTATFVRAQRELAQTQLESNPSIALKTLENLIRSLKESNDDTFAMESARLLDMKASIEIAEEDEEAAISTWNQIYDHFQGSNDAHVRSVVCDALFALSAIAVRQDRSDQAKLFSSRLNKLAKNLPDTPLFDEYRFDALYLHILVLAFLYEKKSVDALSAFRELGVLVEDGSSIMMNRMLVLTRTLLHSGIKEAELIATLSGNKRDDIVLRPLVLALRMGAGDDVREPREISEVAQDVHREIYEQS